MLITAEIITITIPINGNSSLKVALNKSTKIPMVMVRVPSLGSGRRKTAAPISEGIKNLKN